VKRQLVNGIVNRIALVGIELEGGWDLPVEGEKIVHDGSVQFEDPWTDMIEPAPGARKIAVARATPRPHPQMIGEIVSGKLTIDAIEPWIVKCHPQHVNETCGLHVHMSFFNKLNYSRLMVPEFTGHMIDELNRFGLAEGIPQGHMFWKRLDPNHPWTQRHCRHQFLGDKQVLVKKKDYNSRGTDYSRYTFINYCHAQQPTVECRGLPMFDSAELAYKAVMAVVTATNRFLSKIRMREKSVSAGVIERPAFFQEIGAVVR
jgi:hypothetical protein